MPTNRKCTEGNMEYQIIKTSQVDALWELQKLYKAEIGESEPENQDKLCLQKAIAENKNCFLRRI